jgi:hypothetical protein
VYQLIEKYDEQCTQKRGLGAQESEHAALECKLLLIELLANCYKCVTNKCNLNRLPRDRASEAVRHCGLQVYLRSCHMIASDSSSECGNVHMVLQHQDICLREEALLETFHSRTRILVGLPSGAYSHCSSI